jgi:hypothetical protein
MDVMDELIEKMAAAMSPALLSSVRPDSEVGPGTRDARNRLRRNARAVLRVLAEHGDTQQVREQVIRILSTSRAGLSVDALDAVMAVVADIVAARDAAVERAEYWKGRAEKAWERGDEDGLTMLRLEAALIAARRQLDAAEERADEAEKSLAASRRGHDAIVKRAERAEADLAAARMQVRVRDARLDQVQELNYIAWTVIANVSGGDWTKQADGWQEAARKWRDDWHATLDAPARPAGYDAKERT